MKALLLQWRDKLEALSERERGLALLVVIALLYTMFDTLLLTPLHAERKALLVKEQQAQLELEALTAEMIAITEREKQDPDRETRERITAMRSEIARIDSALYDFSKQLIPPREMTRMLEQVLQEEKGLKLLRAESLPPVALTATPGEAEEAPSSTTGIYRHGLRLEFEGGYLQTLAYLRKLEQLPWKIYWDGIDYRAGSYPKGRAAVTVNTLSFNENWIGM